MTKTKVAPFYLGHGVVNKQSELMIITKFRCSSLSYSILSDIVLHSKHIRVLTLCSFYFINKFLNLELRQHVRKRENIARTLRGILRKY